MTIRQNTNLNQRSVLIQKRSRYRIVIEYKRYTSMHGTLSEPKGIQIQASSFILTK